MDRRLSGFREVIAGCRLLFAVVIPELAVLAGFV
jgi:hypothetical protein